MLKAIKKYLQGQNFTKMKLKKLNKILKDVSYLAEIYQDYGGGSGLFFYRHKDTDKFYTAVRHSISPSKNFADLQRVADNIVKNEHSQKKKI